MKTCERCGRRPATARDVIVKGGRLALAELCAECLAAQARGRIAAAGGVALAALAAALGAAIWQSKRMGVTPAEPSAGESATGGRSAALAGFARQRTPFLNSVSRDLTQLALEARLDPVIGREVEIDRLVRILARRTKNNPVLIGEAGVGKTAIVEGLAMRIVRGEVPAVLRGHRVLALSLAGVVAGTKYRGEFEARLNRVLDELRRNPDDVIVFIDELHTIVGAGSAEGSTVDAANMLKPALARGDIRCIGATTFDEYRKHIESDAALERRFQPIVIDEPSPAAAAAMLRGLCGRYERHHGVRISDDALEAAVQLSTRYIADRYLPDKAFDVLDEACAMVALRAGSTVGKEEVARVVSGWTGVPLETLSADEAQRLLRFEDGLQTRVVGQNQAVAAVAECVRRSRAGIKEHRGPMGALLFVGPTGVGKTELARATASALFGSDEALLRFDMSEFSQPNSVSRLIGAPPGYVGFEAAGALTEAVRRRPYCVVLFDDVNRAHAEVSDLLLQLLDEGRLTDAQSRTVDFRNALVILTANLPDPSNLTKIGEQLGAEFINRLDDVVVFHPLDRAQLEAVARLQVRPVIAAAKERGIALDVTDAAIGAIAAEADDPRQGARLIRRVIERRLSSPLSKAILAGEFAAGQRIAAEVTSAGIQLRALEM